MRKKLTILSLLLPLFHALQGQSDFTQKLYGFRVESDLVYGAAVNYAGLEIPLTLDLYKPVGDGNKHRPLAVLVHGGAWLTGCKENEAWLAQELAQRGYVVASVNYRKGWHKDDYVANPINPSVFAGGNCLYAADSAELIRAIYRGQQDVKGAIRWLKGRSVQDSTCSQAVLVSGESAGAFIALAVALLDRPSEKPDACYALPDAPTPASNVSNCYEENCVMQTIYPTGTALQRPDLGSIDGNLNLNGYNANVVGVGSFFGAVPYEALTKDWIQGPDTPAIYLYHQTCDGIVPFGYGQPMTVISAYCNLGYTPWHYNYPHTFGNGAIAAYLQSMPSPPLYTTDFLQCPAFDPNLALFECLRYSDNGSYHYAHNQPERAQKFADFFSPVVKAHLNAGCNLSGNNEPGTYGLELFPSIITDGFSVQVEAQSLPGSQISLYDFSGKRCWQETMDLQQGMNQVKLGNTLPQGVYVVEIRSEKGVRVFKVVRP